MKWRRGFTRTFVVLAIGWAVFVPFIEPYITEKEEAHEYEVAMENCRKDFDVNRKFVGESLDDAQKLYALCTIDIEASKNLGHKSNPLGHWWEFPSVPIRIGVLVVPPLVVFGLFQLMWFLVAWILQGFRQPTS